MRRLTRSLGCAAIIVTLSIFAVAVRAADGEDNGGAANRYALTPLVSDQPGKAAVQDPVLQNAWGVAFSPGASPFWIADNATGCSTLYDGDGTIVPLKVSIPLPPAPGTVPMTDCVSVDPNKPPPNPTPAAPTGVVWNPTTTFLVPNTTIPAAFIFATENGTISAWARNLTPAADAVMAVDNSAATPSAVYKGLAFGANVNGVFLFATNFRAGTIDVFAPNGSAGYQSATTHGSFNDPNMPKGYAPFGIQNINGDLFVTYAKQDAAKHDDVAGPGNGFVDVFNTDGDLLRRFASRGKLNSPWGVARASFAFGKFSGKILVGNFGDGKISVYEDDGSLVDQLKGANGKPLVIDGLWTLTLGGGAKSSSDALYFTAGPNGESDGLLGTITPMFKHK